MPLSSQLTMLCFSRGRKAFLFRLAIDLLCILLVAAGLLSMKYGVTPYHRGFFCDDESIKHPVLSDTVTSTTAALVGALLPAVMIILVEALFRKDQQLCLFTQPQMFLHKMSWMMSAYNNIAVFIFGMAVNQFLTDIGKYSVGRLRPHFLTLCNPDFATINCSKGFITDDVCRSTDDAMLKEARGVKCAYIVRYEDKVCEFLDFTLASVDKSIFAIFLHSAPTISDAQQLYLQTRFYSSRAPLLKPTLQVVFLCLGFYCCLSRISDYKHHWSDVLAGAILGIVVCICIVRSLTDFGKILFFPRTPSDAQLCSVVSTRPSSNFTENTNSDASNDYGFGNMSTPRVSEARVKVVNDEVKD